MAKDPDVLPVLPDRRIACRSCDTTGYPLGTRMDAWARFLSPLLAPTPAIPGDTRNFEARMTAYHFGAFLLCHSHTDTIRYLRARHHIMQDGQDHYILHARLQGCATLATLTGSQPQSCPRLATSICLAPGDLGIMDMSCPILLDSNTGESVTLVMPRRLLMPYVECATLRWHGHAIRSQSASGMILAQHLLTLAHAAPNLQEQEAQLLTHATVKLIATCMRLQEQSSQRSCGACAWPSRQQAIREYIEMHLHQDNLDVEHLLKHQGISRSQLYRLFEPFGGVSTYIRTRRLERSLQALCSLDRSQDRISDIAYTHGFTDEAHFSRLFRRQFGCSPRHIRESWLWGDTPLQNMPPRTCTTGLSQWLMTLG